MSAFYEIFQLNDDLRHIIFRHKQLILVNKWQQTINRIVKLGTKLKEFHAPPTRMILKKSSVYNKKVEVVQDLRDLLEALYFIKTIKINKNLFTNDNKALIVAEHYVVGNDYPYHTILPNTRIEEKIISNPEENNQWIRYIASDHNIYTSYKGYGEWREPIVLLKKKFKVRSPQELIDWEGTQSWRWMTITCKFMPLLSPMRLKWGRFI